MNKRRWASGGRVSMPNMFDKDVQTNKTSPIKYEKRKVLSCSIECLMAFKYCQTWPNTIKHQTAPNTVAKHGNGKIFGHQTCLKVFGRQTFPVWTDLNAKAHFYIYLLVTELYWNIQIELEEKACSKWSSVLHLTTWWPGFERQVFS